MEEAIAEEEVFEHCLRNFLQWLQVLTLSSVEACDAWGNYNVAWELVSDLKKDGNCVISMPCSYLAEQQKQSVAQFLESLSHIPETVFVFATTVVANQEAMNDPCWVKYRQSASALSSLLDSAATRNRAYFHENEP
jgi:hypothetical protein